MAVSIKEALELIYSIKRSSKSEIIPIELALDRVITHDIVALHPLPIFNNSAMDGYAVATINNSYNIIDTILAGDNRELTITDNNAMKIMTGAKVPKNTIAIIPIEDVEAGEKSIKVLKDVRENQHIRFSGEDIKKDSIIINASTQLHAHHIALLASQGISYIEVYQKLHIAIFASGDELKMHYEALGSGELYNTNAPTLQARAKELGCEVVLIKSPNDSIESIKSSISKARNADLIITTGGVSVGDADFTKSAFNELGIKTLFEGIDIKPGKPTTMGLLNDTVVLNLPGNPLAMALIFEIFGVSTIMHLQNRADKYLNTIKTNIDKETKFKRGKYSVVLGYFDGESFTPDTKASPGMVLPQSNANSFMIIDKDIDILTPHDDIHIIAFRYNFGSQKQKNLITKVKK